MTSRSASALELPYGVTGETGSSSVYGTSAVPSKTTSVDTCTSLAPWRAAAPATWAEPDALTASIRSPSWT